MSAPMQDRTFIHLNGTLRYQSSDTHSSLYLAPDGSEVYLQHGTAKQLVWLDDLDMRALWSEFVHDWEFALRGNEGFRDLLRDMVIDPEGVDELTFCFDCNRAEWIDDTTSTGEGWSVCGGCLEDYWFCGGCDQYFTETRTTLADGERCQRCSERYYSWCDHCDGYYPDALASDHNHGGEGCECESPVQSFSIRNDGLEPLANDTSVTVSLPAGAISQVGMTAIAQRIQNHAMKLWTAGLQGNEEYEQYTNTLQITYRLEEIGDVWQTTKGNFAKRLSRFAYNEYKVKLPPEVLSEVGNIARDHSTAVDHLIEVTRNLNLPAEEFAHDDSCWWQSYAHSRCALKSNGGFGLRTFKENAWGRYVNGRAWVIPLRRLDDTRLNPTFDTMTPDAFIVFNGYGDLGGYVPARILSHMAGWTYRKVEFPVNEEEMYVNNSSGYLVAPEEIATRYTDGSLDLSFEHHANLYATEQNRERMFANA